ncbi:hypothetical protein [Glycomyces tenuis]|uniref:hypothetical protein n=1 Tax=Glycomyces tenuis TaxID=58116 RepID=UPI0003F7C58B|nr:hypothetical protein [Glycomyces tenuis]
MAAAVRVAAAEVIALDPFGKAIAAELGRHRPVRRIASWRTPDQVAGEHREPRIVAGGKDHPNWDALGDQAIADRVCWLPAILKDTKIDIGPLMRPGGGVCHRCVRTREWQHEPHRRTIAILKAAGAVSERLGFLPGHVRLAASVLERMRSDDAAANRIVSIRLLSAAPVSSHTVIGVHGCGTCASSRPTEPDGRQ